MDQEKPGCSNPVPNGDCPIIEKMEKRTCALCPEGHEWSQIYFSPSGNIVAHENCLLYSSGLVESEAPDLPNTIRNFDVKSVKKEIGRGRRLKCSFCKNKGATMGCDLQSCTKNYHLSCAMEDHAILQVDEDHGTYKLFCQKHAPEAQEPTQRDYEGIETLLFESGLFEDTLIQFQEVIKSKACEWEERQRLMKQQLEALADLQQSLCSYQENGDLDCSSSTSGSLLPPEDHQVRCQESPEVQAGSGDSL
eukprot:XP_017171482.1 PREDICTED: PHD finger protein 11 family member isoform X3 [Mus musculus]